MNFNEFKRVLTAFADTPADVDATKGGLIVQIRDELIEGRLSLDGGDVYVEENGEKISASRWLINRIAKLPLLADRIISYVPHVSSFVVPAGRLLDQLEESSSDDEEPALDAKATVLQILGRKPAGTTSVLYLTADAGEGKTSLINHLANIQAKRFKAKESDWILVPIPLGGRGFLRFDDVTIAALVNRLRFQFFYYDAFLELVRLGVIVPAFDGFEEMFIEGSSGEAVSALGNLVKSLQSSGSVLVAARKAFFEYRSFRTQARLFDAVGSDSVSFARIGLQRWTENQFVEYAKARGFPQPEELYARVSAKLRSDHPILTRAVLVRRLLDVASENNDIGELLNQVGNTPQDYFFQFVNAIVEREAEQKWLDKAGDAASPLLSIDEHNELLSMVAQEMWIASSNVLRADVLEVIADVYTESKRKAPAVARQVRERLRDHPLLVSAVQPRDSFLFDHEDFQEFYLGQATGAALLRQEKGELTELMRVGSIPRETCEHAALYVARNGGNAGRIAEMLQSISDTERGSSFIRDNAAALAIAIIHYLKVRDFRISKMMFPSDALSGRTLHNISFEGCYFQPTTLIDTELVNCDFTDCQFDRLEVSDQKSIRSTLLRCEIGSVYRSDRDDQLYDPNTIDKALQENGFAVKDNRSGDQPLLQLVDPEIEVLERMLRVFMRTSHANENVIKTRLGTKANMFFDNMLPRLLRHPVLVEVPYHGSGTQRRYKLCIPMQDVQKSLSKCSGSFALFFSSLSEREGSQAG